jgi:hypothetical protein
MPYPSKDEANIGRLDPLILGRANVVFESAEMPTHPPAAS